MNYNTVVISPTLTHSPFCIPDSPPYISSSTIKRETNISLLQKWERKYSEFLEKKCQILLLLDAIDEIIDIREALLMQIYVLEQEQRNRQLIYGYNNFRLYIDFT